MITERKETLDDLKTSNAIDFNKITFNKESNDFLNKNNKKYIYLRRIRKIIFFSFIFSIIVGIIYFFVIYYSERNNKKLISFQRNINNNDDNKDGYYIPKDSFLKTYYKKCSIENCKKCLVIHIIILAYLVLILIIQ